MAETYTSKTLRELIRVVAGRFLGMSLIFIVIVGAAGVATVMSPKWYRSEVQLLARPGRLGNPLENQASMRDEVSLFVTTQRQIIASDYVLASALMRLQGTAGSTAPAATAPATSAPSATAPTTAPSDSHAATLYSDADVDKFIAANDALMRAARNRIEVVTPGGPDATFTQTLTIRVDWPQEGSGEQSLAQAARQANQLAGFLVDAYLMRYAQLESLRTTQAAEFLQNTALGMARKNLDKAAQELDEMVTTRIKGDLLTVKSLTSSGGTGIETGKATLNREFQGKLNDIEVNIARSKALLEAIDEQLKLTDLAKLSIPDAVLASDPTFAPVQDKITALKLKLNALQIQFEPAYQEVRNTAAELEAARKDLRVELDRHRVKVGQELAILQAQREAVATVVGVDKKRLDELSSMASQYQRLQDAYAAAKAVYDTGFTSVSQANTAQKLAQTPVLVTILDRPSMPDPAYPRRPIFWLNMLIAVFAGLVLALTYAVLADHFDHTIKSIDDAERYLGVPVLASVPKLGRDIIQTR